MIMNPRSKRMLDKRRAAREGRRFHAFYLGCQAQRSRSPGNPHKAGTEDHASWQAGWQYAGGEEANP